MRPVQVKLSVLAEKHGTLTSMQREQTFYEEQVQIGGKFKLH